MERETATYTCPRCRRRNACLADELGDHGCGCGWNPDNDYGYPGLEEEDEEEAVN